LKPDSLFENNYSLYLPSPGGRGLRGGGKKLLTLTHTLSHQGRGEIFAKGVKG